jgi:hypothetical protein
MVLCPFKNKPAEVLTKRGNVERRIGGRSETSHAHAHTPIFIVVLICQVVHMFTDSLHFFCRVALCRCPYRSLT